MANTINLAWVLPTTRTDGTPLAPADIAHTDVSVSDNSGSTWNVVASVAAPDSALVVPGFAPGTFQFKLVVVDKQTPPKSSADALATVTVNAPALAAPSPATSITATVV